MGMDIYGKQPTNETGSYFRNNCWWWRPLAIYINQVAPEIAQHCTHWQSNDGDGLNSEHSLALADVLQSEVDAGKTSAYATMYEAEQAATPDEVCNLCHGTGTRPDMVVTDGCNKCHGKGKVRPWSTEYPFSVENVLEFIAFLRGCGGFEIN